MTIIVNVDWRFWLKEEFKQCVCRLFKTTNEIANPPNVDEVVNSSGSASQKVGVEDDIDIIIDS